MRSTRRSTFRILLSGLVLSAGLAILIYRLFALQVVRADELSHLAGHQHEKTVPIEGERGTIKDRNGKILATNVKVPSIYGVPGLVENSKTAAGRLGRILGVKAELIRRRLSTGKKFVWIDRRVSPEEAQRVQLAGLSGIGQLEESRRFYPKRQLMGHLLGFAGLDNRGLEGIELFYDSALRGEEGWVVLERDAHGQSVFPKDLDYALPSRGMDLVLTVDEVVQHIAERELDRAMDATQALGGTVVVMDPRTGEILALAVRPTFNPNQIADHEPGEWRIRAVTDTYEPGSTVKIVAASAALEKGLATPDDLFYCEKGRMEMAGGPMRDHEEEEYLTFREVIQKSSNICTVKIAMRVGE
ncbi:MAG TPA: penicillin-binding protein 2, partial [Nitrospiria bacterium]